jgi:ABC-2 type transport system ATP-binding protein
MMIELQDVSKHFGATKAVDHLSFTVEPGRVTGFLGPNGAGKTTTMRLILGLDQPTTGSITVDGRPFRQAADPMRQLGALVDADALIGARSVYDHLLCLAQSNALSRSRVREVLEFVGLSSAARRKCRSLSLGMKQRLGIAVALLGDPKTLMFDEPVNGLDTEGIIWIRDLMKAFAAEGRTVFVSSHLMSEMQNTADHLIVIGRGKLIASCTTKEFISEHSEHMVKVVTPQPDVLTAAVAKAGGHVDAVSGQELTVRGVNAQQIGDLAFDNGARVYELTPVQSTLEQAYIQLTAGEVEFRSGLPGAKAADGHPEPAPAQPQDATAGKEA